MTIVSQQRPSKREIDKRLKEAKTAILEGRVFFANYGKIYKEVIALRVEHPDAIWKLLVPLLEEIELDDYEGGRPPQESYEPSITDLELWAFAWDSCLLNKRMYLKFALKKGCFYYVSLHESKEPLRKGKNELLKM